MRLYDFDIFEHIRSVSSDFWLVNSEFCSFLQNKSLNHTHKDIYTIYICCVYSVHMCVVCVCMCVCVCIYISNTNRTHFGCRRSFDKTANDPRWGKKRKAGNVAVSVLYGVSIKFFPHYRHLLQENCVEYKHIFLHKQVVQL
jgi:hypothetical protein